MRTHSFIKLDFVLVLDDDVMNLKFVGTLAITLLFTSATSVILYDRIQTLDQKIDRSIDELERHVENKIWEELSEANKYWSIYSEDPRDVDVSFPVMPVPGMTLHINLEEKSIVYVTFYLCLVEEEERFGLGDLYVDIRVAELSRRVFMTHIEPHHDYLEYMISGHTIEDLEPGQYSIEITIFRSNWDIKAANYHVSFSRITAIAFQEPNNQQ
jgi:hypothetical protein